CLAQCQYMLSILSRTRRQYGERAVPSSAFDNVGREYEDGLRNRQTEGSSRLEIDHQLEFRRLLNREICWFGTLQDLVDVGGGAPEQIRAVRPIGHEPTGIGKFPEMKERRQMVFCRQIRDPF